MPIRIRMSAIMIAGRNLELFGGTLLPEKIQILMYGSKMVIKHKGKEVFSMKTVKVWKNTLMIDYPKTVKGEEGKGWGILGMLIALYYGQSKGCNRIDLMSMIEHTTPSLRFWTKFGIARMENTPLMFAMERGIGWVLANCPQEDATITDFVLR